MLLYRTLLALTLLAVPARALAEGPPAAEPTAQPPAPAADSQLGAPHGDVEAVFEGAKQALVFDRKRGEYVVVRVGDTFQGLTVTAISRDQLVLSAGAQHYVLSLPRRSVPAENPSTASTSAPAPTASPAPTTPPIATPALRPNLEQPLDPYLTEPTIDPYAAASTPAPAPAAIPAPPPVTPVAPSPAESTREPAADADPIVDQHVSIARGELDAALADFTALSQEIQLVREGERVRVKHISKGTFLHRLGLRAGDLLVSVADKAIYDLDAAAQAYAVVTRANAFVIKLYRGDNRMKIHVQLKP
jgi:hypothetical protein